MRPIDADELLDEICRDQCERKYKDCDGTCEIAAYVVNAPTVATNTNVLGKWISVKDRLPEIGTLALVFGSAGAMTVARYIAGAEWVVPGMFSAITHWMPLPAPPKE